MGHRNKYPLKLGSAKGWAQKSKWQEPKSPVSFSSLLPPRTHCGLPHDCTALDEHPTAKGRLVSEYRPILQNNLNFRTCNHRSKPRMMVRLVLRLRCVSWGNGLQICVARSHQTKQGCFGYIVWRQKIGITRVKGETASGSLSNSREMASLAH